MVKVIISGGGTGGHVFPAIAIANALKAKVRDIDILFIGAKGRMEMEKVPAAGYRIEGLTISGFQRRLTLKNLSFPFKLLRSMLKARKIISGFKPDVVVGVGGYASGPTLRIATEKKIPTLIQEQNSFPGVTNRLLAKKVDKICVAYPDLGKYFPQEKLVMTGNPIRQDLVNLEGKEKEGRDYFGLQETGKTVLIIGGSLGAGTINKAINNWVRKGSGLENIKLIWQTGRYYHEEIKSQLSDSDSQQGAANCKILPFIDRMDLAYAVADLIVSRAGAIAISELCMVGKPVILIPSPNVAEDHQTKNAEVLVSRKAALMVKDSEAEHTLADKIVALLSDQVLQHELYQNIRKMAVPDAAGNIAEEVLKLIPKKIMEDIRNSNPERGGLTGGH